MSTISGTMKKLSRNLNLKSGKNGYAISVAIALLIASILLGVYYLAPRPAQEGYLTLYLFDSQRKATNYPERLVNGENSTFSIYVEVENHYETAVNCTIQVKITSDMNPKYPVDVNATQISSSRVESGDKWENIATVSLNQPGDYMVIFELWTIDGGVPKFSGQFTQLNIQVLNKATA
ncbi:MAG TPA: DUF1616 domain-containing protein [Candidatus Bathyarchaeia archaeon]|nr:DUF1616 domain-containing protein [Candidatus Bathyarchaeia archaeon]